MANSGASGGISVFRTVFLYQDAKDAIINILVNKELSATIRHPSFWSDKGQIDFGMAGLSYDGYRFNWAQKNKNGRYGVEIRFGIFANLKIEMTRYKGKSRYNVNTGCRSFDYWVTLVLTDFWGIMAHGRSMPHEGQVVIRTTSEFNKTVERMPTDEELLAIEITRSLTRTNPKFLNYSNIIATNAGLICACSAFKQGTSFVKLLGDKVFSTPPGSVGFIELKSRPSQSCYFFTVIAAAVAVTKTPDTIKIKTSDNRTIVFHQDSEGCWVYWFQVSTNLISRDIRSAYTLKLLE